MGAISPRARPTTREVVGWPTGLEPRFGVGPDGAATFLLATGDNPGRLRSEAAFAALCGASPIPASSGRTTRHGLNRGGDRQASAALHRVVVVRLRWNAATQAFLARRLGDGKTKPGIMRCLKRYVACVIHGLSCPSGSAVSVLDHGVRAA